jgi:AraC family transcriptional regulator of adaptative response / methylphosphotriester-DNA alkyltransferase methyltransferase
LQGKRCEIAAKMLRDTNLSVGEIIRKTGYENESFFRRKFKEMYGEYPLKYRKKYEEKGENL